MDLRSPGACAQLACITEAFARKPGNVHPGRGFEDATFLDFVLSAAAIAPVLDRAPGRPVGETVLECVQATRRLVGTNTNLGIVLLLAPLAALPRAVLAGAGTAAGREALRGAAQKLLSALTRRDAALVYEAIRRAAPGGLGAVERGDVRLAPSGTLLEMMEVAAGRDLVALQYADAFAEVIDEGLPCLQRELEAGRGLEEAVVWCFLGFLSRHGDSLIARKLGEDASREAARRAAQVLAAGWPEGRSSGAALDELDRWLREDGHRRNPGACADLTAAALFLAIASGIIVFPLALGGCPHEHE